MAALYGSILRHAHVDSLGVLVVRGSVLLLEVDRLSVQCVTCALWWSILPRIVRAARNEQPRLNSACHKAYGPVVLWSAGGVLLA